MAACRGWTEGRWVWGAWGPCCRFQGEVGVGELAEGGGGEPGAVRLEEGGPGVQRGLMKQVDHQPPGPPRGRSCRTGDMAGGRRAGDQERLEGEQPGLGPD